MRKDRLYILKAAIKLEDSEIVFAECGCPAGMGPKGSCKHIAALAYALVDFCRFNSVPSTALVHKYYSNGIGLGKGTWISFQ